MTIDEWFNTSKNFKIGVQLYKTHPLAKMKIIRSLDRGYNRTNYALLVSSLRKLKNTKTPKKSIQTPFSEVKEQVPVNVVLETKNSIKKNADESLKVIYGSIKYNLLPPELKVRFREAKDLFYQKCDLKHALNELPKDAESDACKLVFSIDDIDKKQSAIWKELQHWQTYKTLLPTEGESFEGKTPIELLNTKSSTKSQITRINGRIEGYYSKLFTETDAHQIKLIEQQIQRSEKRKHIHELNLIKIEELICQKSQNDLLNG